jgi:hypothetical protein
MWKLGLDSKTAKQTVSKQDQPSIAPTDILLGCGTKEIYLRNTTKWPNQHVLNKTDHQYSVTVMD